MCYLSTAVWQITPRFCSLPQYQFIIVQFLWARNPVFPQGLSWGCSECTGPRTEISFEGSMKKYLLLNPLSLLAIFSSFQGATGWKSISLNCHLGLSHMSACFIKACKLRQQYTGSDSKVEIIIFCKLVMKEIISSPLPYCVGQNQVSMAQPSLQCMVLHKGMTHRTGRSFAS